MYVSLDTETTGLNSSVDEVLSLSMCDAMTGEEVWHRYYRPERHETWPSAQSVNGISPDMVAGCPSLSDDAQAINAVLHEAELVVVYNADFDLPFLRAAGIDIKGVHYSDPMVDFAEVYGEWSDRKRGYKWQRLTKAAQYVGYEWTGRAHDSLADCRAAAAVWRWLRDGDWARERVWQE